jgi:hypothetical protein
MRARNTLTRLAAVAPSTEPVLDAGEEDRILARIFASDRPATQLAGRRRVTLAFIGVAVVVAAIVLASVELPRHSGAAGTGLRLTGAPISLAGFHFRTPAGYQASSSSCGASVTDRFDAAASADGGCVEVFYMISANGSAVPAGATPVDVGAYQGYTVSPDAKGQTTLYVALPTVSGADFNWQAVVFFSHGLTVDQLVAVAESGLPPTPSATVG